MFVDKQKAFFNMNNIFTILNKLLLGMGFLAPKSGNGVSQLFTAPTRNHPGLVLVFRLQGLAREARLLPLRISRSRVL